MAKAAEKAAQEKSRQNECSSSVDTDSGALERFHQTLKIMLRAYCMVQKLDWDKGIPLLFFAARESTQESLGFFPFKLVFGHLPQPTEADQRVLAEQ